MKSFYTIFAILTLTGVALSLKCSWNEFECSNGNCIPDYELCNNRDDCTDGSDELSFCTGCGTTKHKCANGTCIRGDLTCNQVDDCGDMSDEIDPITGKCPPCPIYFFQCSNGRCVEKRLICDAIDDCGDNSDEMLGNPSECPACQNGEWQCKNGKCVADNVQCNGKSECLDWSDESEEFCPCADNEIRCPALPGDAVPPGACILPEHICDLDNIWDCVQGWDEQNCTIQLLSYK